MTERYAFRLSIDFPSLKETRALIKVSETRSSACSKLLVFLRARESKYSALLNKSCSFIIQFYHNFSYILLVVEK